MNPTTDPTQRQYPPIIPPTVGRVMLYHPGQNETLGYPGGQQESRAAIVTHVWGPRMVNLVVFAAAGEPHTRSSVLLQQAGDPMPQGAYASWMPYQVGQALGASHLQEQLDKMDRQLQDLRSLVNTMAPRGPARLTVEHKAHQAFARPLRSFMTPQDAIAGLGAAMPGSVSVANHTPINPGLTD